MSWSPWDYLAGTNYLATDVASVTYQLQYALVFPDPSLVSEYGADSGLLLPGAITVTGTSTVVLVDSKRTIEGVQSTVLIVPVVELYTGVIYYAASSQPLTVTLPCGCGAVDSSVGSVALSGAPSIVKLVEDVGQYTTVDLLFTPRSLCNSDFHLYINDQLSTLSPTVSTQRPERDLSCSYVVNAQPQADIITWDKAGRSTTYCLKPAVQAVCSGCLAEYQPGSTSAATSPDTETCLTTTPSYWFVINGQVMSGSYTSDNPAPVAGVTMTAYVQDRGDITAGYDITAPSKVQASVTTDRNGEFNLVVSSTELNEEFYQVLLMPTLTDTFTTNDATIISSDNALVQLTAGTALFFDDSSSSTVTNTTTTLLTVEQNFTCAPIEQPQQQLSSSTYVDTTLTSDKVYFCAVQSGTAWSATWGGIMTVSALIASAQSGSNPPLLDIGYSVASLSASHKLWRADGQSVYDLLVTGPVTGASPAALYLFADTNNAYLPGASSGVGLDTPSASRHVLDSTGLSFTSSSSLLYAPVSGPVVASNPQQVLVSLYTSSSSLYVVAMWSNTSVPSLSWTLCNVTSNGQQLGSVLVYDNSCVLTISKASVTSGDLHVGVMAASVVPSRPSASPVLNPQSVRNYNSSSPGVSVVVPATDVSLFVQSTTGVPTKLLFDSSSVQYTAVNAQVTQPPATLYSSFTWLSLAQFPDPSFLPPCIPPVATTPARQYNPTLAAQLANALTHRWSFDTDLDDWGSASLGQLQVGDESTVLPVADVVGSISSGDAPFIDSTHSQWGKGSLYFTSSTTAPLLLPSTFSSLWSSSTLQSSAMTISMWVSLLDNSMFSNTYGTAALISAQGLLSCDGDFSWESDEFGLLSLLAATFNQTTDPTSLPIQFPSLALLEQSNEQVDSTTSSLSSLPLNGASFTHVALTANNGVFTFYVNGSAVGSLPISMDVSSYPTQRAYLQPTQQIGAPTCRLGSRVMRDGQYISMVGWMDEVMLFSTALSDAAINQLYLFNLPYDQAPAYSFMNAPPTQEVSTEPPVCNSSNAVNVTTTVTVSVTTVVVTNELRPSLSSGLGITYTVTDMYQYSWDDAYNATLPFNVSAGALYNEGLLGDTVLDPYIDTVTRNISTAPYLTVNGMWLSPMAYADNAYTGALTLVIPAGNSDCYSYCYTADSSEAPDGSASFTDSRSSGPTYPPPATTSLAVNTSITQAVLSVPLSTMTLTLGNGYVLSFSLRQTAHFTTAASNTATGPQFTDNSKPITVTLTQYTLLYPDPLSGNPQTAGPTSAPIVLTLYNVSAVLSAMNLNNLLATAQPSGLPSGGSVVPVSIPFSHTFISLSTGDGVTPFAHLVATHGTTYQQPEVFFDESAVSVSGVVLFATSTKLPGIDKCGVDNIVIDAFSPLDTTLQNPLATTDYTSDTGAFSMSLTMQQDVILVPRYNDDVTHTLHTFSPTNMTLTVGNQPLSGLIFTDTTLFSLNMSFLGGDCNLTIGAVQPVLLMNGCGGRRIVLDRFGATSAVTQYLLPPIVGQLLSYTANSGDDSGVKLENGKDSDIVNSWLMENGRVLVNLTLGGQAVTLKYYNDTIVTLTSPVELADTKQTTCASSPGNADTAYAIMAQNTSVSFTFVLTEIYPGGLCKQVDPERQQVWVRDTLAQDQTLECVAFGCVVTPVFDSRLRTTTAIYNTRLGQPYPYTRGTGVPAYTRDFSFGVASSLYPEAQKRRVLITGTVQIAGTLSIKLAPSSLAPLYILRKPPGGSSSATFSSTFSMSTETSVSYDTSYEADETVSVSEDVSLNINTVLAPFGGGIDLPETSYTQSNEFAGKKPFDHTSPTLNKLQTATRFVVPPLQSNVVDAVLASADSSLLDLSSAQNYKQNPCGTSRRRRLLDYSTDCTYDTTLGVDVSQDFGLEADMDTTSDQAIIDGDGDQFLLVVADILVSLSTVVQATPLPGLLVQCEVTPPYQAPSASLDVKRQLLWVSQWQIRNEIVPQSTNFVNSMRLNNGGSNRFDDSDQQLLYSAANTNGANWAKLLTYNERLKQAARPWPELIRYLVFNNPLASPMVTASSGVGTTDLTSPMYVDGNDVVVSFAGDMGELSFSLDFGSNVDSSTSTDIDQSASTSSETTHKITIIGAGLSYTSSMSTSVTQASSSETSLSSGAGQGLQFIFSDPDLGDSFDVLIRRDPVYNTPVYVTTAGKSRCKPEANTVAREQLEAVMRPAVRTQIPADGTATSVLEITNGSPFNETFSYFLNVDHESNSAGLIISANGVQLAHNAVLLQLRPGLTSVLISMTRMQGSGYTYPRIGLSLTGLCYEEVLPVTAYAYRAETAFSVSFVEPCPTAEFAGDLRYSSSFSVSLQSPYYIKSFAGAYYPMTIFNPEAHISTRTWGALYKAGLLRSIVAEVKSRDASAGEWQAVSLVDALGNTATFAPTTASEPGDVYSFNVDLRQMEGTFDFRVRCVCSASVGSTVSPIVTGVVDHLPPKLVGPPLPFIQPNWTALPAKLTNSTGMIQQVAPNQLYPIYYPGEPIRLTFNEDVLCRYPGGSLQVLAWVTAGKVDLSLSASTYNLSTMMNWHCHDNVVDLGLDYSVNWFRVAGWYVVIWVGGVTDSVGNAVQWRTASDGGWIKWAFQCANFQTTDATVLVADVGIGSIGTQPSAGLQTALDAAFITDLNASASAGSPGRRLLAEPSTISTPTDEAAMEVESMQAELVDEVVRCIHTQLSSVTNGSFNATLSPAQVVISSLTLRTVSFSFYILACSHSSQPCKSEAQDERIEPATAAAAFVAALSNEQLTGVLGNATRFPWLSRHQVWEVRDLPQRSGLSSINVQLLPAQYAAEHEPSLLEKQRAAILNPPVDVTVPAAWSVLQAVYSALLWLTGQQLHSITLPCALLAALLAVLTVRRVSKGGKVDSATRKETAVLEYEV